MSKSRYTGGCLCGALRYEAGGTAADLAFCHCTSCRRATGATPVPWGTFPRREFVVTRGELQEFPSSARVFRGFCRTCGSSLTYRHEARPGEIDVALATLDDPEALRPQSHIWLQDRLSWSMAGDD